MANETGYYSEKFSVFKETTPGVTPATVAKAFNFGLIAYDLNKGVRQEKNPELGNNGEGTNTDTGGQDPKGSIEVKYKSGLLPLVTQCVLGLATSTTAQTTAIAVIPTAYSVDDVVTIVATDTFTKYLVCKTAGTSSGSLVVAGTEKVGSLITDGTVVWIYRDEMAVFDIVGTNKKELPSIGIFAEDSTEQGGGVSFDRLGKGFYMSNLSLAKEGGNVIYKSSISLLGMSMKDSTESDYVAPTITATELILDTPYKREHLTIKIGGVEPSHYTSFNLNIDRKVSMEDEIRNNFKEVNVGIIEVSGSAMIRFTKEEFASAQANDEVSVVIEYRHDNGDYMQYTFPLTEKLDSSIKYSNDKSMELEIPLNARGIGGTTSTVSYIGRSATNF